MVNRKFIIKFFIIALWLVLPFRLANATTYTYPNPPGTGTLAVAPITLGPGSAGPPINNDTLEIFSPSTFSYGSGSYVVQLTTGDFAGALSKVTVDAGATLTSSGATSTIIGSCNGAGNGFINILGTVSKGSGTNAINLSSPSGDGIAYNAIIYVNLATALGSSTVGTISGPVILANQMIFNVDGLNPIIDSTSPVTGDGSSNISLQFGSNSSTYGPVTFATAADISGIPTIGVNSGQVTINNAISGVDSNFNIGGGTVILVSGGSIAGTGNFVVGSAGALTLDTAFNLTTAGFSTVTNGGTINVNATFTIGSLTGTGNGGSVFTNNNILNINSGGDLSGTLIGGVGSVLNIGINSSTAYSTANITVNDSYATSSGNITIAIYGIETIHVYSGSSFTQTSTKWINNLNTALIVDVGATATFVDQLSGSTGVSTTVGTNNGTIYFNDGTSISDFLEFNNNNLLYINTGTVTSNITITNNKNMIITAILTGGTGGGAIVNSATNNATNTLTFSTGTTNDNPVTNYGIFDVNDESANTAALTNYATMNVNAALTGSGTIANSVGTLYLNNNGRTEHVITNAFGANVLLTGDFSTSAAVNNSGYMKIFSTTAGAGGVGAITNLDGSVLELNAANITNPITNDLGASLNVTAASTTFEDINSSGAVAISAPLTTPLLKAMTGAGSTVTVNGNQTLTGAYTNAATHIVNFASFSSYGGLAVSEAVDLTDATVQFNTTFTGVAGVTYGPVTILSGSSLNLTGTTVTPPSNTLFNTWELSYSPTLSPTSILLAYSKESFASMANPGPQYVIARVLDGWSGNTTVPSQLAILAALSSVTTKAQFDQEINKLVPNMNPSSTNIATQNAIFGKIENRIAAVRDERTGSYAAGFNAGDINPNAAVWVGSFGSMAKQSAIANNPGYKGKSLGILVGLDCRVGKEDIRGFAFGKSHSTVDEYSNFNFNTKVEGYHGMAYGSQNFKTDNFFEWLVSGAFNQATTSRGVLIGGTDFSAAAKYNFFQGSTRLNLGTNINFGDYFRVSPLGSLRYILLDQPDYEEQGGGAALQVQNKRLRHILTMGVGARMSFPVDDWWLVGSRELRAMATYDLIYTRHVLTANFVSGGDSFTIIDSPSRVGIKLGADFGFRLFTNFQLQFSYDFEMRHKYSDHSGMIKLRYLL